MLLSDLLVCASTKETLCLVGNPPPLSSSLHVVRRLINVDFADIKTVMRNSGTAMLGVGYGVGPDRALQAAYGATNAPLIQSTIERATGIVYNITGSSNLTLAEVNTISEIVTALADPSCNIIFGSVIDEECPADEIRVSCLHRASFACFKSLHVGMHLLHTLLFRGHTIQWVCINCCL